MGGPADPELRVWLRPAAHRGGAGGVGRDADGLRPGVHPAQQEKGGGVMDIALLGALAAACLLCLLGKEKA